ncbi:MAG TPA: CPBP family intramembrane metalloprotease [Phycisphaerales bacterium]|nr:CPBP family intramembrane metalloprotease [Phycisphaerales bacterium]
MASPVEITLALAGLAALYIVIRRGAWRPRGLGWNLPSPSAAPRALPAQSLSLFIALAAALFGAQILGGVAGLALLQALAPPDAHDTVALAGAAALGAYLLGTLAAAFGWIALRRVLHANRASPESDLQTGLAIFPAGREPSIGALLKSAAWVLLAAIPLCTLASILTIQLARAAGISPPDELAHETLRVLVDAWLGGTAHISTSQRLWSIVIALGAIVGAPVVEELIFRMGIQSGALAFCKRPAVAVALSTAIFVLVHVGPGTFAAAPDAAAPLQAQPPAQQAQPAGVFWTALPALAVLGWILGVTYERTRSVFVPILVHMGFNAVNLAGAVLLTAAGNSGPGTP